MRQLMFYRGKTWEKAKGNDNYKNVSNVLPVAMETSDVPESPPPAVSEENGSTTLAADPVLYPVPPTTEQPSDFERLWKAAHDSPQDFTSWTDLLQYCEQEVLFL